MKVVPVVAGRRETEYHAVAARRKLERLVERGHAERCDDPDGLARYFIRSEGA